ncbi:MAG TPA: hypothetical protein DHV12_09415, partial [Thermotogae bacterium]|nr:hypothetical protein [Thermotogota bacterium]
LETEMCDLFLPSLLMREKKKASRVITCVLSSYFFLEAIVCECLRRDKRSATAKTSCWNTPLFLSGSDRL